jgi:Mitochondrial K+-H+ exchange-related
MDVYLVPVGVARYELYCEIPDEPAPEAAEPQGYFRKLIHRFRETIAEAERERRHGAPERPAHGWMARVRARMMRWVAESIAEQRLLWHLRGQHTGCLFYPDDLQEHEAVSVFRQQLGRDFDKHRFWLVIDSIGFVGSGLLVLLPGPNVLAYYFAFRLVGHYLSLRGAKRGLSGVAWHNEASAPLTELRRLLALDPDLRESRVHAVAASLRLEHFASFFERSAVST